MTNKALTKDIQETLKQPITSKQAPMIDFSCSDLTEEEIATYMLQLHAEQARERRQEEKRMEKARSFRFSGGMC